MSVGGRPKLYDLPRFVFWTSSLAPLSNVLKQMIDWLIDTKNEKMASYNILLFQALQWTKKKKVSLVHISNCSY